MALAEITEDQIRALGIKTGSDDNSDISSSEAEQYESWAIPQVDTDFPSNLDTDLRELVITLLVCHYAELKERRLQTQTTVAGSVQTKGGELGDTQYGKNYLEKVARFGDAGGEFELVELKDEYTG